MDKMFCSHLESYCSVNLATVWMPQEEDFSDSYNESDNNLSDSEPEDTNDQIRMYVIKLFSCSFFSL
jgi:hypothetical protein